MKVILTKVSNLGNIGDEVRVKNGYARNYLIPQGHAVSLTTENMEHFAKIRTELEKEAASDLASAQSLAKELAAINLEMSAKVSDGETIFGSISVNDIMPLIHKHKADINKRQVSIVTGNISELGTYEVNVKCHRDVTATISLIVTNEGDSDSK
jgi:large subunit ribosomal protein L9